MKALSWHESDLASVVSTLESGSRPKGGASTETGEVASLGGENIVRSGGVILAEVKRVPQTFFERMTKGHLVDGDVLINKDGAQTGKVGIYLGDGTGPACINEHVFLIRGDKGKIFQDFLYYTLLSEHGQRQIIAQISGSAQPGLKSSFLKGVVTDIPESLSEQTKIAEILSMLDRAIEQTLALIAKKQRIKTGLMQDLLPGGIDEHGNVRSEQTYKFKDSPLGRIPVEWDVVRLQEMCSAIVDCPHSTPTYTQTGVPCIRTADMEAGHLLLNTAFCVDEQTYSDRVSRLVPQRGDIIYSREGERLGIASPVGDDRVCLGQRVMLLRANLEDDPDYLLWSMNSQEFYSRSVSGLGATTSPHINVEDIKQTLIKRPASPEQKQIGKLISAQHSHLRAMDAHLSKVSRLKTALMQDLLTGKKRVTPLLEPETAQ